MTLLFYKLIPKVFYKIDKPDLRKKNVSLTINLKVRGKVSTKLYYKDFCTLTGIRSPGGFYL